MATLSREARPWSMVARCGAICLLACWAAACSVGDSTPSPSPTPTPGDVTLVLHLQSIGPEGKTPAQAAVAAGALDCVSYLPYLPNPGGPSWVVHLRVPSDRVDDARAAVAAFGATRIVTAAPGAFSTPPATTLASGADPLPC